MSQTIFWDVIPFEMFSIDSMPDKSANKQNQVIIFLIQDMKHKPLVSFCYEDVCNVLPEKAMEKVEIYIQDISIKRDNIDVIIDFGKNEKDEPIVQLNCRINEGNFEMIPITKTLISKTIFNNYEYIEKTIIDRVLDHEDKISQLINQVKKIKSWINNSETVTS